MTLVRNGDGYIEVIDRGESWVDAPEDVDPDSEEYWNYSENSDSFYLRTLSGSGAVISEIELDCEELFGDTEYYYFDQAVVDGKGNLLVGGNFGLVAIEPETGKAAYRIGDVEYVERLLRMNDGTPMKTSWLIFLRDLSRLKKNIIAIIVIAGV
jgi:hypothetical protein